MATASSRNRSCDARVAVKEATQASQLQVLRIRFGPRARTRPLKLAGRRGLVSRSHVSNRIRISPRAGTRGNENVLALRGQQGRVKIYFPAPLRPMKRVAARRLG